MDSSGSGQWPVAAFWEQDIGPLGFINGGKFYA
jgi:hypothetical protein